MKRSEINAILEKAIAFLDERKFLLPPFSAWTPDEWKSKGPENREIVEAQLGWDITDFGSGDFDNVGLFLFTVRNGTAQVDTANTAKTYAEKVLIVEPGQVTPTHFHFEKMEDIINRGGGDLAIQLWNSTEDKGLADTPIKVTTDGVVREVPAGGTVILKPGESVTLPPYLYHKFWGEGATVLVGEVSRVNDDRTDNYFYEDVGRFPDIEEDVEPFRLLTSDYARYYNPA